MSGDVAGRAASAPLDPIVSLRLRSPRALGMYAFLLGSGVQGERAYGVASVVGGSNIARHASQSR
jgi:hypothetical protein